MKSTLKRLLRDKATPLLVILIVLMLFTMVMSSGVLDGAPISAMFTEGFMARVNILSNFYNLVIQIFMLVGLSCILISGNIDLSIAGQAMLGSLIFAYEKALKMIRAFCFMRLFLTPCRSKC